MIALISLLKPLPDSRHSLVLQHIPHVRRYVRSRFRNFGAEERRDLMAAALLGLVEAASRYDAQAPSGFWPYARMRVHGAVADHLRALDPLTRTQRHAVRQMTRQEPSDAGGYPAGACRDGDVRRMRGCRIFLFSELETDPDDSFVEGVADDHAPSPEESARRAEMLGKISSWFDDLPERERQVIDGIYRRNMSAHEVAEHLSLTDGRISQLHRRGLQFLRERLIQADSH